MSVTLKTKLKIVALKVIIFCYANTVYADDLVEFNTDVLDASDRTHVDLSRFASDNYVAAGDYLLDIKINSQPIGQDKVHYALLPDGKSTQACISQTVLDKLALKEEARLKVEQVSENCFVLQSLPGAKLSNYAGTLDITVPQAWMKYNDPNWTPPERWDNGIAGVIFDYSLTGQLTHQLDHSEDYNSLSGYGQAGFNVAGWRFRSEYQTSY